MAFCARTLLPAESSGGEITAIPNFPGETAMIPPPTPLLAGRPVWYSHFASRILAPIVILGLESQSQGWRCSWNGLRAIF